MIGLGLHIYHVALEVKLQEYQVHQTRKGKKSIYTTTKLFLQRHFCSRKLDIPTSSHFSSLMGPNTGFLYSIFSSHLVELSLFDAAAK